MNKTSVLMSAAAIAICASSASFAMGLDNMYVGPQIAMSSVSDNNTSDPNSTFRIYGAVIGSQINDMFSADLNYLTEGNAYSIMVDGYFNRALSSKVTSRFGLGLGLAHVNSQTRVGFDTVPTSNKLGYQAILEMDYAVSDSLSLVTGYHYMTDNDAEDSEHANMFVIGAHYKLNATA